MKFEDRISEYPGRIKLTDENGEAHYYTLERADEPTQPGTPLSAENLNKLTQDVNGKTGASIVLTGDDIPISASDNTTVKERIDSVRSAASTAQSTADTAVTKANAAQNTATARKTSAQTALNNQKIEVLWENGTLSGSFIGKKININFMQYKMLMVLFLREEGYINDIISITTFGNARYYPLSINNGYIYMRSFLISSDGILFDNALEIRTLGSYGTNNNNLIPYKVIGILK